MGVALAVAVAVGVGVGVKVAVAVAVAVAVGVNVAVAVGVGVIVAAAVAVAVGARLLQRRGPANASRHPDNEHARREVGYGYYQLGNTLVEVGDYPAALESRRNAFATKFDRKIRQCGDAVAHLKK